MRISERLRLDWYGFREWSLTLWTMDREHAWIDLGFVVIVWGDGAGDRG